MSEKGKISFENENENFIEADKTVKKNLHRIATDFGGDFDAWTKARKMNEKTETAAVELLPCPFCKGRCEFDTNFDKTRWFVFCRVCLTTTNPKQNKEHAAEFWNHRADNSRIADLENQIRELTEWNYDLPEKDKYVIGQHRNGAMQIICFNEYGAAFNQSGRLIGSFGENYFAWKHLPQAAEKGE